MAVSYGYTLKNMLEDRAWLLVGRKMSNEATVEELEELDDIMRVNPELHFSLQTLADLWTQQNNEPGNQEKLEKAYSSHLDRMKASGFLMQASGDLVTVPNELFREDPITRFRFSRRMYAAVCGIAATVLLCWFTFQPYFAREKKLSQDINKSEISTQNGSKSNIVLPDGTRVWLNAGSKLMYDKQFGDDVRQVSLLGEAYFDVAHDADRPFIIHTQVMDIKVLGTEFNVKSYPEDKTTETSLIRGSIEVTLISRPSDKIIMKPNEKLVVNNESDVPMLSVKKKSNSAQPIISLRHLNYFSLDSTILETSWVQNRLLFEDESFEELSKKMERWYGVEFQFLNEEIRHLRFTGNFKDETILEALQAMQITADFQFTVEDKKVAIRK